MCVHNIDIRITYSYASTYYFCWHNVLKTHQCVGPMYTCMYSYIHIFIRVHMI